MRFLNFELDQPSTAVAIVSRGYSWDLHNCAHFSGLVMAPDGSVVLTWVMLPNCRPSLGDPNDPHSGCEMRFRNVRRLKICGRDSEMPTSEDLTLDGISMVDPFEKKYS